MKKCSKCHVEQPLDQFSPSKAYKDKHASVCKTCQRMTMKALRIANPEKSKEQRKKANTKRKESGKTAEYESKNKEKIRARQKAWFVANAEHVKQRAAAYYQSNKEHHDAVATEWNKANTEKIAAIQQKRRAKIKGAPINDFTSAQWEEMQALYKYRCAYCPDDCKQCIRKTHKLTQDHITPLSKGGSHTKSNIVPACKSCNSKKHVNGPLKPVQPLLL